MTVLDDLAASFESYNLGTVARPHTHAIAGAGGTGVVICGWFGFEGGTDVGSFPVLSGSGWTKIKSQDDVGYGHSMSVDAYNPDTTSPPDPSVTWTGWHSTAAGKFAAITLATLASAPVQTAFAGRTQTLTLDSTPTPGNVVIVWHYSEGSIGAPPAGWTDIASIANIRIFGRIIQPGDPKTIGSAIAGGWRTASEWAFGATPAVDFHGTPTSGKAPLSVDFTDDSTGSPTSWLWDFGDGGSSTSQNPTHVYAAAGTYTVSLTATNDNGSGTETKVAYIHVLDILAYDVYRIVPPGDSLEVVGTLTEGFAKSIRPVRNDVGSGTVKVNKNATEATAAMLTPGNLVRVRIPEIDDGWIFAWFMENGDFTLVDPDEEGGEDFTFGGQGILTYLSRAIWRNYKYSIEWWPADVADPPAGAEGLLRVQAGRYRFFHMTGPAPLHVVPGGAGKSFTWVTTGEFDSYFEEFRGYPWPYSNGKGTGYLYLVKFMAGETFAAAWMSPTQNSTPAEMILPGWAYRGESIKLTDAGASPGEVLYRMIQEAQHPARPSQPIPLVTIDFTATEDSNGDPWTTTDQLAGLTAELGEDYLTTIGTLLKTGVIDIFMDPDFVLHAYNSYGRDLTGTSFGSGVVRFAKGVNISERMTRELLETKQATHAEVLTTVYDGFQRAEAELTDAADRVTREVAVVGSSQVEAELEALGLAALEASLVKSDALQFEHVTGDDEDNGLYLPGPEGTDHGKYWLGDEVTIHTGTGEQDFNEEPLRVWAVTISADDDTGQLHAVPEVSSQVGEAERDLYGVSVGIQHVGGVAPYSTLVTSGGGGTAAAPSGGGGETVSPDIVQRPSAAVSIEYEFSTTTTDSDPGDGILRLSNAVQSSAVTIRADNEDMNGVDVTALLDLFDSGRVRMVHSIDPTKWIVFDVTAVADATGYRNITVAWVASSATSPFEDQDPVTILADLGGGGGSALTVEEVDGSPTDAAITKIVFPNGTLGIVGHAATYTPATAGLTVEETDASPTDAATTSIQFPKGTLAIASHVATFKPHRGYLVTIDDPTGSILTAGVKGDLSVLGDCAIKGWTILGNTSGSISIEVWKDSLANYPPVVGDKISASAPIALSSTDHNNDTTLTGWSTGLLSGDTLRFNVTGTPSGVSRVTILIDTELA